MAICWEEHIPKHMFDGGSRSPKGWDQGLGTVLAQKVGNRARPKVGNRARPKVGNRARPKVWEPAAPFERWSFVRAVDVPCDVDGRAGASGVTWTDVYRTERDGLVRLAYLMTGSQAVAEDLVQDTFVRVMAKLDAASEPGAYLRRSVINACYSWHRRSWREIPAAADEHEGSHRDSYEAEMWDALEHLAPRRRTVIVLRYYLDMSEAEVASTLGCRVGTVKSTAHRALKDLRRALER